MASVCVAVCSRLLPGPREVDDSQPRGPQPQQQLHALGKHRGVPAGQGGGGRGGKGGAKRGTEQLQGWCGPGCWWCVRVQKSSGGWFADRSLLWARREREGAAHLSTSSSRVWGAMRAMLWKGVSMMPRFSAARCMNASRSGSTAAAASPPQRGAAGRNQYSTRQPRRLTIQGSRWRAMTAATPASKRWASAMVCLTERRRGVGCRVSGGFRSSVFACRCECAIPKIQVTALARGSGADRLPTQADLSLS
jgi:hypothetical protein